MREKMKKFASVMLAVLMMVMVCVPAVTVEVEAAGNYTITINNEVDGYEYVAYQIFKGDYESEKGILSNIEWGDNIDSSALLAAIIAANKDSTSALYGLFDSITTSSTAEEVAAVLAGDKITTDSTQMEAFAELAAGCVTGTGTTSAYDDTGSTPVYTISGLSDGYYLVVNTKVPDADNASYSFYMLRVVGNASVYTKVSVPSSEKKVGDVNDSTDLSTADPTYDSTADYDVGDNVPFTISAKLGTKFGEYTFYKLVFHDELSSGLSVNTGSFKVTVIDTSGNSVTVPAQGYNGSTYVTNYSIVYKTDANTSITDDCTFEITFSNLYNLYDNSGNVISVAAGYTVQVAYTAELLNTASFKETNTMHLEYSNNPYDSSDTGTTPEDVVTVFNYTLTLYKYGNSSGNALTGASFTLYKYDADTSDYVEVKTITGTNTNVFSFSGLDDGKYMIVESVTPAGYNTVDPIYITITAETGEDSNGDGYLKSLNVLQTDADGNTTGLSTVHTFSTSTTTGTISTNIINYSGSSLPTTGGMGTTIFYMVGGVLVIGAAVLLITGKRMRRSNA